MTEHVKNPLALDAKRKEIQCCSLIHDRLEKTLAGKNIKYILQGYFCRLNLLLFSLWFCSTTAIPVSVFGRVITFIFFEFGKVRVGHVNNLAILDLFVDNNEFVRRVQPEGKPCAFSVFEGERV